MSGNPSRTANLKLNEAVAAFQAGEFAHAQGLARALIESSPNEAGAWGLLASIADTQGHTTKAIEILKRAIAFLPRDAALHDSLGLLLGKTGRLPEAEVHFRDALRIAPQRHETAANLGNLLARSSRFADAEAMFRTAASLAPQEAKYPLQIGRALLAQRRDARPSFMQAAELGRSALKSADTSQQTSRSFNEPYYDALSHLAALAFTEGRPEEALSHLQEAVVKGAGDVAQVQFANCFCATPFTGPRPYLKPLLARALAEAWIMSADLVRAATRLLLLEPSIQAMLRRSAEPDATAGGLLSDSHARDAVADPLLLAILNEGIVTDFSLERLLTEMRAALLRAEHPRNELNSYRAFTVALANQCFSNEYAFAETPAERDLVAGLERRVQAALETKQTVAEIDVAILAAYRPLNRLAWAQSIAAQTWPDILEPLIARQLREPQTERELSASIPHLTEVADPTSKRVQQQYEENPYPRWIRTPTRGRRYSLDEWLFTHFPYLPPSGRHPAAPLEVLVPGCGTGQDAIGSAQRFANANLLAVDLSLSSLAYAARKTTELDIANIAYAQADILDLGRLERRFDIVECAGVLHHLADPVAGWRVLTDLTVPGGYMLMALYSERGREDLRPVAEFIAERGYKTSADELRRFRSDILALHETHPARAIVSSRDDFYSLSMLRDLVFHVQEHRFTIKKIAEALKILGLQFCGFGLNLMVRTQFQQRFGASADPVSLEQWDTFEAENPDTFAAMYHLVVRKPI